MSALDRAIYITTATASGGRAGRVSTTDGTPDLDLVMPSVVYDMLSEEMQEVPASSDRARVDPEMLFAAGDAGCFISAIRYTALGMGIDASKASVESSVALKPGSDGAAFKLGVRLEVDLPGTNKETGQKIIDGAHKICPYSAAVKDNIEVDLVLR
ncbi:MAG: Ohr family peroxiredoxin [Geminicoccaceae bacterium]